MRRLLRALDEWTALDSMSSANESNPWPSVVRNLIVAAIRAVASSSAAAE